MNTQMQRKAVLLHGADVAGGSLRMNAMMFQHLSHAVVGLEEDGEEGLVLEGDVEAIQSVTSAIHASEEVQDEVTHR